LIPAPQSSSHVSQTISFPASDAKKAARTAIGPTARVLIVDESADSREVLRTALERRGLRIFEASEARTGLEMAREHHPQVIVLDMEVDSADDPTIRTGFGDQSTSDGSHLVVLGKIPRKEIFPAPREEVAKPYHYGPLIRKIEGLLDQTEVANT